LNNQIIIADSGPLIAFSRLALLPILTKACGSVAIPEAVVKECTQDKFRPGAIAIQDAIENKILTVYADPKNDHFLKLNILLGNGESAAIALAVELKASLLIDEKLARSAARNLNLKIIGTAGVLLLAKQKKIINAVLPIIKEIKKTGYYLSDTLIQEISKISGESVS
jgi:predicted nucleic acid-binding protein